MLPSNSVLEEISKLKSVQRIQVSIKSSVKYGTIVGATTIAFGIVCGPLGLALGSIISGCMVTYMSFGKYQSVPYILLHETTPEQKQKLVEAIYSVVKPKHIITLHDFISSIQNDTQLQETIIQILVTFLASELGATVKI